MAGIDGIGSSAVIVAPVGGSRVVRVADQVVKELSGEIQSRLDTWDDVFVRKMAFQFVVDRERTKARAAASEVIDRNEVAVTRLLSNEFTFRNALRGALMDAGVDSPQINDADVAALAAYFKQQVSRGHFMSNGYLGSVGSPPGDVESFYGARPGEPASVATSLLTGAEPLIAQIAAQYLK